MKFGNIPNKIDERTFDSLKSAREHYQKTCKTLDEQVELWLSNKKTFIKSDVTNTLEKLNHIPVVLRALEQQGWKLAKNRGFTHISASHNLFASIKNDPDSKRAGLTSAALTLGLGYDCYHLHEAGIVRAEYYRYTNNHQELQGKIIKDMTVHLRPMFLKRPLRASERERAEEQVKTRKLR